MSAIRRGVAGAAAAATVVMGLMVLVDPAAGEVYELRTYTTNEGKLEDLHARFRDHTIRLFAKHGMESIAYWTPAEDDRRSENTLIYILRHESREAAKASWKAFLADPEWKRVAAESQKDGRLLAERPESVFMETTDYSPEIAALKPGDDEAVFELRVCQTADGKLGDLDARFRDHLVEFFRRHGRESVGYWHPVDEPDSRDTLIYLLRHDNREAAEKSRQAFLADPAWRAAAKASNAAGRQPSERTQRTFLKATEYSPRVDAGRLPGGL